MAVDLYSLKIAAEKVEMIKEILGLLDEAVKAIKAFSHNKTQFEIIVQNVDNIKKLYDEIEPVKITYLNINALKSLSASLSKLLNLQANQPKLLNVESELAKLIAIHTNLAEILQADNSAKIAIDRANKACECATTAITQANIATMQARHATQEASNVDEKVALVNALTTIKMGSFRVVDGELFVTHADNLVLPTLRDGDLILRY